MSHEDQDFVVLDTQDLADFNTAGLLPQSSETIDQILEWLQPTDYAAESSEYNKHLASYVPGTGIWIQESSQFKEWLNSSPGALWIKATAGAGKSVVAARIASLLAAKGSVPVLSFFFRQIIATNRTPQAVIRDVCKFPEHFIPLIVHFASLDTPFGCLSAPKTFKKGIETRESRGSCLNK